LYPLHFLPLAALYRLRGSGKNTTANAISGKSCVYFGLSTAAGVLIWHSFTRRSWIPIDDNFDALIWLACCWPYSSCMCSARAPSRR